MTAPGVDLGNTIAGDIIAACLDSWSLSDVPAPSLVLRVAGVGAPTTDPCPSQLWVRTVTEFPTDGSGVPYVEMRPSMEFPAWCYIFEVGVLDCHPVINEDGTSPDADEWSACAVRDGQYRYMLLYALTQLLPPRIKPCVDGISLTPWTPIGPEGGYSGGILVVTCVSTALAA